MSRHLRREGHSVTIVATAAFGALDDDAENSVLRVADLRTSALLRKLLHRGELPVAGSAVPQSPRVATSDAGARSGRGARQLDAAALSRIRRLAAAGQIDCLVTSSPPESTHLIGLLLGRHRPPWVVELRDGWMFEPIRQPFPTSPQRRLNAALERRVVNTADVVVGATRPIAEDVAQRFGSTVCWVSNGWDPEDPAVNGSIASLPGQAGSIPLVHTGSLGVKRLRSRTSPGGHLCGAGRRTRPAARLRGHPDQP